MIYLLGFLVALFIVTGQVLWKIGVTNNAFTFSKDFLLSFEIIKFVFSPYIFTGIISYAFATLMFMFLLSKFQYTHLQAIVVSSSLICTLVAATLIFDERLSIINLLGILLLIIGVIFVTKF